MYTTLLIFKLNLIYEKKYTELDFAINIHYMQSIRISWSEVFTFDFVLTLLLLGYLCCTLRPHLKLHFQEDSY